MHIHFGWLLVIGLYKKNPVNRLNHKSLGAAGTPSDRPELFRNYCVIEVLVAFSCCHFIFILLVKGFRHTTIKVRILPFYLHMVSSPNRELWNQVHTTCMLIKFYQTYVLVSKLFKKQNKNNMLYKC